MAKEMADRAWRSTSPMERVLLRFLTRGGGGGERGEGGVRWRKERRRRAARAGREAKGRRRRTLRERRRVEALGERDALCHSSVGSGADDGARMAWMHTAARHNEKRGKRSRVGGVHKVVRMVVQVKTVVGRRRKRAAWHPSRVGRMKKT